MANEGETTPLFSGEGRTAGHQEAPPSYDAVMREQTQPVMPSAPPASVVDQQPHHIDPYPPQPVSDPNTRATTTTTTTTTYVTTTETRTRERSCCDCCQDVYCPGFIFCFYVPTPCPASCDCDCLPPTTHCCGGCNLNNCGDCGGGDDDNPVVIIIVLVLLALLLVALIGIIAFLIYRLGDDKSPAVAKRYRIFAVVFAAVAYSIMIAVGIAVAIVYA